VLKLFGQKLYFLLVRLVNKIFIRSRIPFESAEKERVHHLRYSNFISKELIDLEQIEEL
jgi:hypothetical protein